MASLKRSKITRRTENQMILDCLDGIETHRRNLQTVASLLSLCGDEDDDLRAETIRDTGHLLLEELEKMHLCLEQLDELKTQR